MAEEQNQLSEHEQAMVDKIDQNEKRVQESMKPDSEIEALENTGNEDEGEQTLYAGKYKTIEDMEKAYKELESKLGAPKDTPEDTPKETPQETPPSEDEAKDVVESKGLDFSELNVEFADKGELSQETYEKLAESGIPKATVDAYIAGQQALVEQNVAKIQASIGGEGEFNSMMEWAVDSLSETEKNAFNKAVNDESGAEFAVQGLYARYKAQAEPTLLKGNTNAPSVGAYQSKAEMTADMHSPQYKKDPAFRAMVMRKIAKSNF